MSASSPSAGGAAQKENGARLEGVSSHDVIIFSAPPKRAQHVRTRVQESDSPLALAAAPPKSRPNRKRGFAVRPGALYLGSPPSPFHTGPTKKQLRRRLLAEQVAADEKRVGSSAPSSVRLLRIDVVVCSEERLRSACRGDHHVSTPAACAGFGGVTGVILE